MGKTACDECRVVIRGRIRILPDAEPAGIMTATATDAWMASMFVRAVANGWIVAIAAGDGLAVCAVAVGAGHTAVHVGRCLLFDYVKAMTPLVTMAA